MLHFTHIHHRAKIVTDTEKNLDSILMALEAGDTSALQWLYQQWGRQVYSLAYAITQQRETAEEITQDVFLRVWHKVEQFQKGTNFRAWLLTITRNLAIDRLKQDRHTTPLWDDDFLQGDSKLMDDDTRWVHEALHQLPSDQRLALELAYLHGMTHEQIAAYLQTPLGTIKTHIRNGVQKLRHAWEQDHDS